LTPPKGAAIDTSTDGAHTFTVTANNAKRNDRDRALHGHGL